MLERYKMSRVRKPKISSRLKIKRQRDIYVTVKLVRVNPENQLSRNCSIILRDSERGHS